MNDVKNTSTFQSKILFFSNLILRDVLLTKVGNGFLKNAIWYLKKTLLAINLTQQTFTEPTVS